VQAQILEAAAQDSWDRAKLDRMLPKLCELSAKAECLREVVELSSQFMEEFYSEQQPKRD
jgi:hypothetical protein